MRLGAGLLLLVAAGCSSGDGSPDVSANALRATRADGSRIDFPGAVRAWCGPTEGEATDALTGPPGLHVLGGERPAEGAEASPFWLFTSPTARIERVERISLPDRVTSRAVLFVLDATRDNELSSADEEASGSIEVEEWGCRSGDTVRLSVEGTLGSELFEEPTVRVDGTVETVVGEPPAWAD